MKTKRLVDYDCFFCDVCREYVYDESLGEPAKGIAPKTLVDALPLSWRCPVCGAYKDQLRASTLLDGCTYEEAYGHPVNKKADVVLGIQPAGGGSMKGTELGCDQVPLNSERGR